MTAREEAAHAAHLAHYGTARPQPAEAWVSCPKDLSWDVARYRHRAHFAPGEWTTTACGATGTPGSFRRDSRKPECPACLARP